MLPDLAWGAVIGVVSTVIGASISFWSQRESDLEASKRLYRQHAVKEEYEAYRQLYLAFISCIREYREPGSLVQADDYETEIADPMINLSEKLDVASIYLSESDEETLRQQMMKLRTQREYIHELALNSDPDLMNEYIETSSRLDNGDFEQISSEVKSILGQELELRDEIEARTVSRAVWDFIRRIPNSS